MRAAVLSAGAVACFGLAVLVWKMAMARKRYEAFQAQWQRDRSVAASRRRTLVAGTLRNGIYCGGIERPERKVIRYPDSLLRHQQTEVDVRHRPPTDGWDLEILTAQAAAEYLAFVEPSIRPRTVA